MALTIHLLGPPQVLQDGEAVPAPRGHKVWALLAHLLLSDGHPTRERTADLLFPEADDPLGALRSALAQVRRLLGDGASVGDDPIELVLPDHATVDAAVVLTGTWSDALAVPTLERPLLEGLKPATSAAFELWLDHQRRHLAAAAEGVLHEATLATLARSDTQDALDLAVRLVALNPLDDNAQVLYVRCLVAAGRYDDARSHVAAVTDRFRRDLGVDPSPALRDAAEVRAAPGRHAGRATIVAQLEAGEAAVAAGAVAAGITSLQQAAADAESSGDPALAARALVSLGSALVHAARGNDEEGAAALHRAIAEATEADEHELASTAHRELGYVEFLRGHYQRADAWLARAAELAAPDSAEVVWTHAIRGAAATDTGHHGLARAHLDEAISRARAAGATRIEAWARSFLGRLHFLRDEHDAARAELDHALDIARTEGWNAFIPWPECFLGELDLLEGDVEAAADTFEHAFAMGCQLGDPCWESAAGRGLALVAAARGSDERAIEILRDAVARCRRLPDPYRWIEGYALASLADLALDHHEPEAATWIHELETLASRTGMRELAVTAAVLRARGGDADALATAALVAAEVDNPALHHRLANTVP